MRNPDALNGSEPAVQLLAAPLDTADLCEPAAYRAARAKVEVHRIRIEAEVMDVEAVYGIVLELTLPDTRRPGCERCAFPLTLPNGALWAMVVAEAMPAPTSWNLAWMASRRMIQ